jgi:hypothetical protein
VERVSVFTHKRVRVLGIPVVSLIQTVMVTGKDVAVNFEERR